MPARPLIKLFSVIEFTFKGRRTNVIQTFIIRDKCFQDICSPDTTAWILIKLFSVIEFTFVGRRTNVIQTFL